MLPESRRAQVTLFILLGIVVLIAIALLLYINQRPAISIPPPLSTEQLTIKNMVTDCLDNIVPPGVYFLGRQGGFIFDHTPSLATEYDLVAYEYVGTRFVGPTRSDSENDLAAYTKQTLEMCVHTKVRLSPQAITYSSAAVTARILDDKILLQVHYPVTLTSGPRSVTVEDYSYELRINLGKMLDAAKDITQRAQTTGSLQLGVMSATAAPAKATIATRGNDSIIYTLIDLNTTVGNVPFIVRVATKEAP